MFLKSLSAVAQNELFVTNPSTGFTLSYDLNEPGSTITCVGYLRSISSGALFQQQTLWSVTQVGKSPTPISVSNSTFMLSNDIAQGILIAATNLTILNVTSDLDGATITCSNPNIPANTASFVVKIYRKLNRRMPCYYVSTSFWWFHSSVLCVRVCACLCVYVRVCMCVCI